MRDALGEKFISGIALYAGDEVLPFGAWMRGALLATSMAAWLHTSSPPPRPARSSWPVTASAAAKP